MSELLRTKIVKQAVKECSNKGRTDDTDIVGEVALALNSEGRWQGASKEDIADLVDRVKKHFHAEKLPDNVPIGELTSAVLDQVETKRDALPGIFDSRAACSYQDLCVIRTYLLALSNVIYIEGLRNINLISAVDDRFRQYEDMFNYRVPFAKMPPEDLMLLEIFKDSYDERIAWYRAVLCLYQFQYRLYGGLGIAEIQFHSELWNELLVLSIGTRFPPFRSEMEFHLSSASASYPKDFHHYIDVACFLTIDDHPKIFFPILFAEAAADRVKSEQFHKDFRKMVIDMTAALLSQIGIVRRAGIELMRKLKMFGLYLSAGQYHPCVLVPVFHDQRDFHQVSFVLHIQREWLRDLLTDEQVVMDSPDSIVYQFDPNDPLNVEDLESVCERVDARVLAESAPSRGAAVNYTIKRAVQRLERFFAFCQHVRHTGLDLLEDFRRIDRFDGPLPYPSSYPNPVPSRSFHSSHTTPSRPRSGSGLQSGDRPEVTQSALASGEIVVQKRKQNVGQEGELLSAAQGRGIVKLHSYRISGADQIVLIEEALEDAFQWERLSGRALVVVAFRLLIDGLDALQTLMRAGIVHCDISPNNFLYSMSDQAWKLTDFNCSRYCPADGSVQSDGLYGTDGYIAPEVEQSRTYSPASDAYSFGRTALYYLNLFREHSYRHSFDGDVHCKLDQLEFITRISLVDRPADQRCPTRYQDDLRSAHDHLQMGLTDSDSIRIRAPVQTEPDSEQARAARPGTINSCSDPVAG